MTGSGIKLGELSLSVGFLLRLAQVQVFDLFNETLAAHGIRPGEFTVLWVVGLNPGMRQGEIAEALRIKPAHMTKLVQRMVREGYVKRSVPRDDRRAIALELTTSGAGFVAAHRQDFLAFQQKERGGLSAGENDELLALLRKLVGMEDGV